MLNPRVRLGIIAVCILASVWGFISNDFVMAILMLVGAILSAYGYFRYGTVWSAFAEIKAQNYKKAGKLLESIKRPDMLSKASRVYYYFGYGFVYMNDKEFDKAEDSLNKALETGLRTDNDKVLANTLLAQAYIIRGNPDKARTHLDRASKLPHKAALDEGIDMLKGALEKAPKRDG